MSDVFTGTTPTTEQNQTPATQDAFSTPEDFVAKLVGEKGETWKDPQAIAKGYLHAQNRIAELEQATKELAKQDYAKQLLEELQASKANTQTPPVTEVVPAVVPNGEPEQKDNTSLSPDDIQRLLSEELAKRESSTIVTSNLDKVNKALSEKFGTEAASAVKAKADALGLPLSKMQELAGESPDAFLTLVGEAPKKETNSTTTSTVNTDSFTNVNSGVRDKAYYSKLRRENRKSYNSPEVQAQMLNDRMTLGDKFYTNS